MYTDRTGCAWEKGCVRKGPKEIVQDDGKKKNIAENIIYYNLGEIA